MLGLGRRCPIGTLLHVLETKRRVAEAILPAAHSHSQPFLRDTNEDRAWRKGCLWLSLDRFERFWPDAGLALENGEAVKSAIRGALRFQYAMEAANRAKWDADPDAPDTYEYTAMPARSHDVIA